MRGFRFAVAFVTLAACAQLPRLEPGRVKPDWNRTLAEARRNVEAGNYHAADRVLAEFTRIHPETREGHEIAFWRAAYLVDPANTLGSLAGGITALDGYLASEPTGWYRNEASVLRRTAAAAQGLSAGMSSRCAPATATPEAKDTVVVVVKSRDEEIASLRDQLTHSKAELATAIAELERIKKRLANPTP